MSRRTACAGLLLGLAAAACGQPGVATNEFSAAPQGSYVLVDAGPDESDRIMTAVRSLLAREPRFRDLSLSNGLETPRLYSFEFRGPCAAQAALVRAVEAEVAKATTAKPRCVDRR